MFIRSWFINVIPADTITDNEIVNLELKESQNKKEISCMSAKMCNFAIMVTLIMLILADDTIIW